MSENVMYICFTPTYHFNNVFIYNNTIFENIFKYTSHNSWFQNIKKTFQKEIILLDFLKWL